LKQRINGKSRLTALLMAALLVLDTFAFAIPTLAVDAPRLTVTLYSGETMPNGAAESDTQMLFTTYLSQERNPADEITLAMQQGLPFEVTDDAVQLGAEGAPFTGTVRFNAISEAEFTATKALFDYVSTDAQFLIGGGSDPFTGTISITRVPTEDPDNLNSALFADHVVNGSGAAIAWGLRCLNDGENTLTYAGVLGELGAGAKVALTYANDASDSGSVSNIYAQGNVGLLCGAMGENSELTVSLSGTYTTYSIESDSGAAGGLVGVMQSGSKLILNTTYTDVPTVTASGNAYVAAAAAPAAAPSLALAPSAQLPEAVLDVQLPAETSATTEAASPAEAEPSVGSEIPAEAETPAETGTQAVAEAPTEAGAPTEAEAPAEAGTSTEDETPAAESQAEEAVPLLDVAAPEEPVSMAELMEGTPLLDASLPAETESGADSTPLLDVETHAGETAADETPAEAVLAAEAPTAEPAEQISAVPAEIADEIAANTPLRTELPLLDALTAPSLRSVAISASTLKAGYAGGLVGWADNAQIELGDGVTVTVSGTVIGRTAAGGVFGYYNAAEDRTFALDPYTITATLGSASYTSANVGGVFGRLDSAADVTITDETYKPADGQTGDATYNLRPTVVHGANGGGVMGYYQADSLDRTLLIRDLKVRYIGGSGSTQGGVIGRIGDTPAYVQLRMLGMKSSGTTMTGGLVGSMGNGGSFVDVGEYVGLQGSARGGLVGYVNYGVLRLQGVTHMQDESKLGGGMETGGNGQLVYQRGSGLVYAAGTGSDAAALDNINGTGWAFYRANRNRRDDIHDWGEILRLGGSPLSMSDGVVTENLPAHIATIGAPSATMATVQDFARTALHIQLNVSGVPASGALRFAGSDDSAALLAADLALSADIDLSGTGLTGLTRDNGSSDAFTGTLNGGGHTLTLATGEVYGLSNTGTALTAADESVNRGCGRIYAHQYDGLFAKTSGAALRALTLDGTISVFVTSGGTWNIGGLSAHNTGDLTLVNCTVSETVKLTLTSGDPYAYAGGAVGQVAGSSAGTVTVTGGSYAAALEDDRTSHNTRSYFGGVIGYINTGSSQIDVDVTGTQLSGSYTNAAATNVNYPHYGGMIGQIPLSSKRTVDIRNVTIGKLDITMRSNEGAGGLLGYQWLNTDVTIGTAGGSDGLTIGESGNSAASPTVDFRPVSGSDTRMGGLVLGASGYWQLNDLQVGQATFETSAANVDFGFVAASGVYSDSSALYLEIPCVIPTHYDLSGVQTAGSGFDVFDEVVAYTVPVIVATANNKITLTPKPITDNGAAIISLRTLDGDPVIMDGSGCNTYQNQTSYGRTNESAHDYSRYYYNLDAIRAAASPTDPQKLLLWSLNQYANSSIRSYFANHLGSTLTGNFDMEGISYYPVTASGVTVSSATVKFYNQGFEQSEALSGGDGFARSSRDRTQHDLLHCGLLYDAASLRVNDLTVQGTVGAMSDGSGFLVRGTLHDSTGERSSIADVTLSGVLVRVGAATPAGEVGSTYAPLLINRVGSDAEDQPTNLTVQTVQTAGYAAGAAAASSLLGDVSGRNIQLDFSDMRLDARTAALADGATNTALNDAYGTTRAIFTRATLLHTFSYTDANTDGYYNYNQTEDWDGSTPVHHVTYGKEVNGSTEYTGMQEQYYDVEVYTSPVSGSAAGVYDFNGGSWLPYVYTAWDAENHTHELRINQKLENMGEGCGKWDDPYQITDGSQLFSIAEIIRGASVDSSFQLILPDSLTPNTAHTASGTGSKDNDSTYSFDGTNFTDGSTTYTQNAVREYLAGAYYKLERNIELPDTFAGLGAVNSDFSNYECAYAFRGVVDGNEKTLTNNSAAPLIANSNGAVVKNLTVIAGTAYTVTQDSASNNATLTFKYYGGAESYGAVIGKVMGGDTFIDGVGVDFSALAADSIAASGTAARLVPIGGYVGVVVNGGVVFRNIPAAAGSRLAAAGGQVDDAGWLYVNPIIGRVISGYAFSEDCTVDNGNKNYEIPCLDPDESDKLSLTDGAITVPNGQALWVLGAAVNSGAASASSASGNYISGVWSGYRSYTAARTGDDSADPVTTDGVTGYHDSVYSGSNKTPYLLTAYTAGSALRAASAATAVSVTGDCAVPAGFRGIGNLFSDTNSLRLARASVDGGGHTVTLDMNYQEYIDASASSFENYRAAANCAGFGLFNTVGTGGKNDSPILFENLALAGAIYYDVKDTSGSSSYDWNNYESGQGNNLTSLSAGGLVGYIVNRNFKVQNIKLDGLSVQGARYAGGLIGRITTTTAGYSGEIVQCGTGDGGAPITVKGGFSAGGLVGRLFAIKRDKFSLTVTGKAAGSDDMSVVSGGKTLMKLNEIASMGAKGDSETYHNFAFSAGGLFGLIQTSNNSNSSGGSATLSLTDYEVRDGSVKCAYDYNNNRNDNGRAGGAFGALIHSNANISDVTVRHVNVTGFYAGGFCGKSQMGWQAESRSFTGIMVDGSPVSGSGDNAVLRGDASTGGLFGLFEIHENVTNEVEIKSSTVSNCEIGSQKRSMTGRSTTNTFTGTNGAGGLIGELYLGATVTVNLADTSVQDCTVYYSGLTADSGKTTQTRGAGGLIGVVHPHSSNANRFLVGHNLLTYNNSIESREYASASAEDATVTSVFCGTLVGWNSNGNIKLAGISDYETRMTADSSMVPVGHTSGGDYGPNGYAVFADYNGAAAGNSRSVEEPMVHDGTEDYDAAAPYVTVNPALTVDNAGNILTSDGMAAAVSALPIRDILSDAGERYSVAWDKTGIQKSFAGLSSFKTEVSLTDSSPDVAVLVIEASTKAADVTQILNSYLDHLTNTDFDFSNPDDDICEIRLTRMALSGNSFTSAGSVSLVHDTVNHRFAVAKNLVDNNRDSFTLLDAAFKDPADPDRIAYHLYVPILVKKVLEFEFTSLVLPGTTYRAADYAGHHQALENFGTPVTLCFTYTYDRTADEWITALETGDSMMDNYAKSILLTRYQSVDPLPAGTELVLVDAQTGKAYYRTLDAGFSGTLALSSFQAADGTAFQPVSLSDQLAVTAEESGSGAFVRCDSDEADVQIRAQDGYYYKLYTEGDSGQRYALDTSVGYIPETYYLSIFTRTSDTGIARYAVNCPKRLPDSYPTLCVSSDAQKRSDLILGRVYTISTSLTTAGGDEDHVLDRANSTLSANISSTITINDGDIYKDYVGSLYHSFLLHLTRADEDGTRTAVVGAPTASGTYRINGGTEQTYANGADESWTAEGGFAQFTAAENLRSSLASAATGYSATITASVLLDYNANEAAIEEQFPKRPADLAADAVTGTTVFVKSNLASTPELTAYSSNSDRTSDGNSNRFFSRAELKEAVLTYNTKSSLIVGDLGELGVNPLDEDLEVSALIETLGVLNFRDVARQSEGYTHLKVTLTLGQKADDYAGTLNFAEYMDSMTVAGTAAGLSTDTIELNIPRDNANLRFSADQYEVEIPIDFAVKTGSALEALGKTYSNYKVTLDVDLVRVDGADEELLVNARTNFIIYTNARVMPDFID